jgi:soluble lytic murein transglycosylase-like protein
MERSRVVLLVILAVGLLIDGPPADGSAAISDALASRAVLEQRIGAVVHERNPTLSTGESKRIGRAVVRSASKYGLDPELVTAVLIVESDGRPWARSHKGAVGLMQVMPHMVAGMYLAGNLTTIESNVEAGCVILADNIRRLGEDDGISAYFWGSNIRGVAYLDRVRAAHAAVRGFES